jgi:hypothetical protein
MKKKKIIIMALAIAIISGGWYGYSEYTRKVKDLKHVKAHVRIGATGLVAAFEKDEVAANTLYLDRIMAVKGIVKAVEKNDQGHYTVILGDEGNMSSVRCSMDSVHQDEVESFSAGASVTIKGACTGFNADDLLGSDVILNRCVVDN